MKESLFLRILFFKLSKRLIAKLKLSGMTSVNFSSLNRVLVRHSTSETAVFLKYKYVFLSYFKSKESVFEQIIIPPLNAFFFFFQYMFFFITNFYLFIFFNCLFS